MRKVQSKLAALVGVLMSATFLPMVAPASAVVAPVGQGFAVTPSDLAYILKQIKISEAHAAVLAQPSIDPNPCRGLVGTGPNQIASPLLSFGLRTVDGSCNNLQPGQQTFGAADVTFPRLGSKSFLPAEGGPAGFFGPQAPNPATASSYTQKKGNVFDTQPRIISNLIVDQTSTNPAAVMAAGFPVRTQGNTGVDPCTVPLVAGCVPAYETLFIPNVTTDVGLSPPYNSLFTLFGQFFDHGIDQTVKGGGKVFVPLKADDPLIAGPDHDIATTADNLPAHLRFMVLTRGKNQPGADGILGDKPATLDVDESADDVQDAMNTNSPWIDQSQTYTSHSSHQVFVREYAMNNALIPVPVSTGKLLSGPAGPNTDGGMATWAGVKAQAASKLGLRLEDKDITDVPMIAADPYGKFLPGPLRGLPQYVTPLGLVEGNLEAPVPVPANVVHFETPFMTDIAHNADPSLADLDHDPRTPATYPDPDLDKVASADFAKQPPGTYDDEMLDAHFAAGDGRVNENIGLTAIHQVFHSEHDRLVGDMKATLMNDTTTSGKAALTQWKQADGAAGWNGERLFQAARFVTEMEYQHIVFEDFGRKIQPGINPFQPFAFTQTEINPAVKAEFAHAVYRFGHSMLTETMSRTNENGSKNDISLLKAFLNPPEYTNGGAGVVAPLTSEEAAGSIIMGMSDQVGEELDEFVTETLRNNLLGLPLDLAAINITRARSEGIPRLNVLRRELFASTNDAALKPYVNWIDFGENLKNPASLVNFVAAYGKHTTIVNATTTAAKRTAAQLIVNPTVGDVPPVDAAAFMNSTDAWANVGTTSSTGLDDVDLWIGGLAEFTTPFGGLLGSTFNYVFESQMTELQNADRFYYLARTPGMNLRTQLEGNSFGELVMRNTNAHSLKADSFATADCKFELKNLAGTVAGFTEFGNNVVNDPLSECNETALLIRMPDGTIKYRARNAVDPLGINGQAVYNGTAGVDRVHGGNDNDTFWGGLGNDVIEGGGGADIALGGEGNDIITDFAGDDISKGGPGNDAIEAGPGLDILMGGEGKDFTNGGANANTTFAGAGDDFAIGGQGMDPVFGDSGDDWEEGGDQPDLLIGDSSNTFFMDDAQKPGHDILIGQGGDDDYDMEGGDDIGVAGPGIEKVAGGSGYDWEIGLGDPQPQDADLALPIAPLGILTIGVRDKFNEAEALSGGSLNDTLRGDDIVPSAVGGGGFIGCDVLDQQGLDRIAGLDALVPALTTDLQTVIAQSAGQFCPLLSGNVWGDGNILLGGAGSDLIEGRGADDIIDGDRYLSVRLSVRTDPALPSTEIGSASVEGPGQSAMTSQYLRDGAGALTGATLQQAVFAGTVDPGNIVAVREVITPPPAVTTLDTDTALFSDIQANYACIVGAAAPVPCGLTSNGAETRVVHAAGLGGGGGRVTDGTDTIRNIEKLVFADSAAPAAPVNVLATAGNASATVTWIKPPGLVTDYEVEVTAAGVVLPRLLPAVDPATSLLVTGLTNGTSYTFRVRAINLGGTGPFSAPSNAVTPVTVPTAPTAVTATAGDALATVNWTAPTDTGGSAITSFTIQITNPVGVVMGQQTGIPATASTVDVVGLTNGVRYRFVVHAVNAQGLGAPSRPSNTVTPTSAVVVTTAPGAPIIRNATSGVAGGPITATANWRAPTTNGGSVITGYVVTATPSVGASIDTAVPAAAGRDQSSVLTLPAGNYRFTVVAVNAVGTSAPSGGSNLVTAR